MIRIRAVAEGRRAGDGGSRDEKVVGAAWLVSVLARVSPTGVSRSCGEEMEMSTFGRRRCDEIEHLTASI